MQEKEWLQSLKAGDEVALVSGYNSKQVDFPLVNRVTATQVIVQGNRFSKKDGFQIGGSSRSKALLREATAEYKQELAEELSMRQKRIKARNMAGAVYGSIPHDRLTLEALISALEPFMPK